MNAAGGAGTGRDGANAPDHHGQKQDGYSGLQPESWTWVTDASHRVGDRCAGLPGEASAVPTARPGSLPHGDQTVCPDRKVIDHVVELGQAVFKLIHAGRDHKVTHQRDAAGRINA